MVILYGSQMLKENLWVNVGGFLTIYKEEDKDSFIRPQEFRVSLRSHSFVLQPAYLWCI